MLFGLLLASLIGMNSDSFVAADRSGFSAVLAGEYLGWDEQLSDAERRYNLALLERQTLNAVSCIRAEEQRTSGGLSHTRPNGQHWDTALPFASTGLAVEVLASGPDMPTIMRAWRESPDHAAQLARPVQEFGYCERDGYFAAHGAWPVVLAEGDIALVTGQNLLLVIVVVLLILVALLLLRNVRAI